MSKFKVGDRVRKVGDDYLNAFAIGEKLTVVGFSILGYAIVSNGGDVKDSAYDEDLEIIVIPSTHSLTLSGKTYTLTPYEAPKLVTIDDVVYVMTEVK